MRPFSLHKTSFDVYAFAILIIFTSLIVVWTNVYNRPLGALYANVYIETEQVESLSLSVDQEVTFFQEDYPVLLGDITLEIVARRVRIKEEVSPLHYCSLQGWIDQPGLPIVCAPNQFLVVIEA
jgi:hypothetical protein